MREKIDCFLPCSDLKSARDVVAQIKGSKTIQHIYLLVNEHLGELDSTLCDCEQIVVNDLTSSATIAAIAEHAKADYALLQIRPREIQMAKGTLDHMLRIASDSDAAMIYADHNDMIDGKLQPHPVIDYQIGSIRDDFDLGSLILVKSSLLNAFASQAGDHPYKFAAVYALRLFLSREGRIFHINERLYTEQETDTRASGEKQFDYVNPRNREVQIEMEHAATAHLAAIGAKIDPSFYRTPDFNEQEFDVEASVVIPVYNREKTICDAVNSALNQKTKFKFVSLDTSDFYAFVINNVKLLKQDFREIMAQENGKQLSFTGNAKTATFTIPESELYKFSVVKKIKPMKKNAYEGYTNEFVTSETRKSTPERLFEQFCERCDAVEWVYKNGDAGQQYFSIVYQDGFTGKQWLFYPDYIVKLTSGDVWIIETKGGMNAGHTKNIDIQVENKFKAFKNYAQRYNILWGFVRDIDEDLYLCNTEYTEEMIGDNWQSIEGIFK